VNLSCPTARRERRISQSGSLYVAYALSALLFEPEPDEAHLNNRSAVLSLVNASGAECHRLLVEGQGAYDPWSVAVAPSRGPQGYTVAAIMGVSSVVLDFDVQTGAAHTLWSTRIAPGAYSEVGVAVGRAGASFAITHNAEADGASVDVYGRREGAMRLLARLTPPKPALSPQALAMAMDVDVLVVAWTDQTGSQMAITLHTVDTNAGTVQRVWQHERTCPAGGSFDLVVPNALAVSRKGELVGVGSWGCVTGHSGMQGYHAEASADAHRVPPPMSTRRHAIIKRLDAVAGVGSPGGVRPTSIRAGPNVAIFHGVGGDGKPVYESAVPGQVWAAAIDTDGIDGYVMFGSWASQDGTSPSQATMFHVPVPTRA